MLRSALLLALAANTFAVSPLTAQAPFEGAISMSLTGDDGKTNEFAYLVKNGKLRFEMPGGAGTMIIDPATKKMLIVMVAQKMYMEQDFSAAASAVADKAKPSKITRTGRTETVAGYKCEHYTVTEDDGSSSDVCVAAGLGAFQMPSSGGRGGPPKAAGWQGALGDGGFPLKVQKGNKVTLEVKQIEKKTLDAALFAAPEGFRKFDMGGMRRGG